MKVKLFILLLIAVLFCGNALFAAGFDVWAIGEGVRINPLTGKAFEENEKMLPGGIKGDYKNKNWIWEGATKTIKINGAANEVIGFQLILEGAGVKGITVEASDLNGASTVPGKNFSFFRAWYIYVDQKKDSKRAPYPLSEGWYPDPLIPLDTPKHGAPFAIDGSNFGGKDKPSAIKNQTVWCDLWIPKGTKTGEYRSKINIKSDAGAVELNVALQVFGFEMPDEAHSTHEFMSYGGFGRTEKEKRDKMFNLAHQHRITITTTFPLAGYSPRLLGDNGKFQWEGFDASWGPCISGELYKEGPRAGKPLEYFCLPFEPKLDRPDAKGPGRGYNWPVPAPTKNNNWEVDFSSEYVTQLQSYLKDASAHFALKYPKTTILVYQDSLDEPGFHKAEKDCAFGQLRSIQGYQKIIRELKLPNLKYKLDIGGGFDGNVFDLDGDGEKGGSKDVVKALIDTELWSIHGLCINLEALQPSINKGAKVWFYNGFEPRVGPTVIAGEALGPRTWPWVVWNSGMGGSCNWQFLFNADKGNNPWENGGVVPAKSSKKGNPHAGDALFIYPGEGIELADRYFGSIRMKAIRRGLQDYEYFYLLAKKDGNKTRADSFARKVVKNSMSGSLDMQDFRDDASGEKAAVKVKGDQRHWSHNPSEFDKVLLEIGEMLSK
jgi:hypothetical protein